MPNGMVISTALVRSESFGLSQRIVSAVHALSALLWSIALESHLLTWHEIGHERPMKR